MKKVTKKVIALTLLIATIASSVAAMPAKEVAAAKKYNCYLMFANKKFSCINMNSKIATTKITNKKGKQTYTVTLKRSKCVNDNNKKAKATKATEAQVFCVDIQNILKDHKVKHIKVSNIIVKCDGKKVKINQKKVARGQLEPNSDPNKYRLEIYNEWGEGGTKAKPPANPKKFKWSNKISVTFTINIKK